MNKRISSIISIFLFFSMAACKPIGSWLVLDDQPVKADAIVILMGSIGDRVLLANDLFQSGYARKIVLVKSQMSENRLLEARGVFLLNNAEQVKNALIALGVPEEKIDIKPGAANSTLEEALIVRNYLFSIPTIDTLLLVTSSPHSRRATIIFKRAFKGLPVKVLCVENHYTPFNPEYWWKSKNQTIAVLLEYSKMLYFFLYGRKVPG